MKLIISLIFLLISNYSLFAEDKIEIKKVIDDKADIVRFLFSEVEELKNKSCHRFVIEKRSPSAMIAVGCKIIRLELGVLLSDTRYNSVRAFYDCDGREAHYTAYCLRRE